MFLVVEGLDGAGTTTQARQLANALRARGLRTTETHEPTERPVGRTLRQALRRELTLPDGGPLDPATMALLFAADRIDHLRATVEPALSRGEVVISDRYVHSSLAYQSDELPIRWVDAINARARRADLVLWLEVPVDVCIERLSQRGGTPEIYEQKDVLERVAQRYEEALKLRPEPVVRIDGTGSVDEVTAALVRAVDASARPPA